MAIKKKTTGIVSREGRYYDPLTFSTIADKYPHFKSVTAEQLLDEVKPLKLDYIDGDGLIAFDTETYYTGVPANRLPSNVVRRWIKIGNKYIPNDFPFSFQISDSTNSFIVFDDHTTGFKEFKKLAPILNNRRIAKCGHNVPYDLQMSANADIAIIGHMYDTAILAKLTRPDAFSNRLIDLAAVMEEGVTVFEYMLDSYKAQHKIKDYRQFPRELIEKYGCADTWNTIKAFPIYYELAKENGQLELYETENKIMRICVNMERVGIKVDPAYEEILIPELVKEASDAEQAIYDQAGCMFNINSSQQTESIVKKLGYGDKIHYSKPTEAMLAKGIIQGNPSFDKEEKQRLINEGVSIFETINIFQKAEKLLNTFAKKLYEQRDFENLVHCNFNSMEAKTGRFSVSQPSMQNMPRRKDSRVRGAFIAPEGFTLYDFDFQSQEAKVLAHYSKAQYLIENINNGIDIHKIVAAIIYDVPYDQVTKAQREVAKSIEFAIVYGAGAPKVSAMSGLSIDDAKRAINTYLQRIPEVDIFIRMTNKIAKSRRFIKTRLNRIVYVEKGREYACVNYVIQGSSADSTKTRMVQVYTYIRANKYKTRMLLQVHDSLLNKVAHDEEHIIPKLKFLQEDYDLFRVPVTVDVAVAKPTWKDKTDIKVASEPPSAEEYEAMNTYDLWSESLLDI